MICGLEGRFERHLRNVNLIIGPRPGVRDRDLSALRAVLDSYEPAGFDLDLDELFETGLGYLLDGFRARR